MPRRTGLVWDERTMWHAWPPHAGIEPARGQVQPGIAMENAETKRRLKNLLDAYGVTRELESLEPRPVDDEVLLRFHSTGYLSRIRQLSDAFGGEAGEAAPFTAGGFELACLSVGAAIAGAHAVVDGVVDNAYVLSRPPGHHAERDRGRGFCLFANGALAILDLLAQQRVERVAVVDWDVHHGNGTEQAFYEDDRVLTISLHEDRLYPSDTGALVDDGEGAGVGFNLNVPLPPGSGIGAYRACFDRVVLPALRAFGPDLIVIACGFDASYFDPMGHMMLLSSHFAELAEELVAAADDLCGGRLLAIHEGGYSESYTPYCGAATIDVLRGRKSDIVDAAPVFVDGTWQPLQPHQAQAIDAVVHGPLAKLLAR